MALIWEIESNSCRDRFAEKVNEKFSAWLMFCPMASHSVRALWTTSDSNNKASDEVRVLSKGLASEW